MGFSVFKRIAGAVVSSAVALTAAVGGISVNNEVSAAVTNYHFDFGNGGGASGYTAVTASTGYDASRGYGFADTSAVKDVAAAGSGALSDAVQFTNTASDKTFNVDLQNGLYRVTVTLGNTNRTSVRAEDVLQIMNMTGNNATDSILIPITDGQLNIMACEGKAGYAFTLSSLDIEYVSSDTALPPTIWFCGDSTVCNYYPKDTSVQAGWGQVFNQFIDSSWNVRNMAASGQYAKGFVDAGQFAPILKYGKEGDMYIISIGINDTNYSNAEEYTETVTSMVQQAKAKGMKVVLVKQQGRASDVNRTPLLQGRWFGGQLDSIGAAENVQVVDLFTPWQNHTTSIGYEETLKLYCENDDLHPNRQGAMILAEIMADAIEWEDTVEGAVIPENVPFMIKNANSGLYLTLADSPADGTNVVQAANIGINNSKALWKAVSAGDGYYRLYSIADETKLLDVAGASAESGANIGIWGDTACDAQLFKFIAKDNGSYVIATKTTNDKSAIEVINASNEDGANVQQWEINGHACQSWTIEDVVLGEQISDAVIIGDVNRDGKVNCFDFVLIKRKASEIKGFDRQFADTNSDGFVNADDISSIGKFLTNQGIFEAVEKKSALYYANEMSFSQGMKENVNAGFKNENYVNLNNCIGSRLEWNVSVQEDGNYLCTFNVANGSADNRKMKIEVNGGKDYWVQDFLTTESWTTWNTRGIVLPLKKGKNTISMISETANGGPNIDYLYFEKTDEPIAEIYIPEEKPVEPEDDGTTIYIAGDSTVQTYRASYAPQQGWGAYLADYFNETVSVSNHAIAGRSSKSFYDNGRLDTILNEIQEGDYLFVQFAINDSASSNAERYAPTCGTVPGTEGSYEWYLAKYIEGAKAKGATPVLVTTVIGLKAYNSSTGMFANSYTNYCSAMKQLAEYYNIPCIDLNSLMVSHYNSIGYNTAYTYHLCGAVEGSTDMTHFTETGANAVAGLVANAVKGLNLDISSSVK